MECISPYGELRAEESARHIHVCWRLQQRLCLRKSRACGSGQEFGASVKENVIVPGAANQQETATGRPAPHFRLPDISYRPQDGGAGICIPAPFDCSKVEDFVMTGSHVRVVRPAGAFRHRPCDVAVRILDIAGFAVHAVLGIDLELGRVIAFLNPLIYSRRAVAV